MLWKRRHAIVMRREQQREQPGEMREVTRDQHVARFAAQPVAHPCRWIVGLQIARRREFRERVARAPARLGRLACAQFPAVPDDGGLRAAGGGIGGDTQDRCLPPRREWASRVDIWADGVAMMNEKQLHAAKVCGPWARVGTLVRRRES